MSRCGSFPLMNLATDYGADYGDVLLMAECCAREHRRDRVPLGRAIGMARAWLRTRDRIGPNAFEDLRDELQLHAAARWAA